MSAAGAGVLNTYFLPTLPRLTNGQITPGYGCGTNFAKAFQPTNNFREGKRARRYQSLEDRELMFEVHARYQYLWASRFRSTGWAPTLALPPLETLEPAQPPRGGPSYQNHRRYCH